MKRLILLLILIPVLVWAEEPYQEARMNVGIVGGGVAAVGGATYPDIIFYWGCESTTAEKSAGYTTATGLGASEAIDTGFAGDQGTASCDFPSAYGGYTFTLNNDDIVDTTSGRIGMYIYCETIANNFGFFRAYYDASNRIQLSVWDADQLRYDYVAGGTGKEYGATSASAWAANTWYFVEYAWDKGGAGNESTIYVNGVSVGTDNTASGTWTKGAAGVLTIGDFSGEGGNCHVDQIIISNDPTRDLNAIKNLTSFPSS